MSSFAQEFPKTVETPFAFFDFGENDALCRPLLFGEAERHLSERRGILCLARTKKGNMTDKRRKIRLTESVSCAG